MIVVLAITPHTGARLAEVGTLRILIAGSEQESDPGDIAQ